LANGVTKESGGERTVSPWVKTFIALHIFVCVVWALPRPKADILAGRVPPRGSDYLLLFDDLHLRPSPLIQTYLFATGTWQYWDMFAPDPARTDVWGDAEIEFADGTKQVVEYPRMYALNLYQKYVEERFRKYYERAGQETGAYLWPMFARELARRAVRDPHNPPRIVSLRRHWLDIAPPGQPQATQYNVYVYFRYVLTPEDRL